MEWSKPRNNISQCKKDFSAGWDIQRCPVNVVHPQQPAVPCPLPPRTSKLRKANIMVYLDNEVNDKLYYLMMKLKILKMNYKYSFVVKLMMKCDVMIDDDLND